MQKGEARLTVSSGPRLAGASDGADTGGVNSKLSSMPERKAIADDLYPARAGHGDGEIHVGKVHIASDPSTSLLADPGDSSLERESAGGKGAGGRAGCSVVAERVKQTTTGAGGRERQRKSQAAKEEHPELSGGDGDCFVSRADCKAAGSVWPGLGQQQRSGRGR